eukprot:TRINITY_DN3870_c0_g1_i3.p1 TRINITY_DN3870_c0_g1~~TRINITY_DN3870_c0_g1_i3.p1  ORF type:complete len:112 (+),score=8.69 TRINITY_DN3870_c0_g1_i3:86-421(+)
MKTSLSNAFAQKSTNTKTLYRYGLRGIQRLPKESSKSYYRSHLYANFRGYYEQDEPNHKRLILGGLDSIDWALNKYLLKEDYEAFKEKYKPCFVFEEEEETVWRLDDMFKD